MGKTSQEEFQGTDRFSILDRLGAGSFGAVYRAYDLERNSIVALKVLRQKDPSALYDFKKEFRALSGVVHPNLVTLYNLMSDGEDWFFTMELVDGIDFLSYVRGAQLESRAASSSIADISTVPLIETNERKDEAATLRNEDFDSSREAHFQALLAISADNLDRLRTSLAQLGTGICAIHAAGKLHRDLKPSNVLVTNAGRVVILDFGLVTDVSSTLSHDALLAGTPNYMSPEQAAGLAVAEPSDWYAVGVILYEALTGRLPFQGHTRDVLKAKQLEEPPAPHALISSIPEDLSSLCLDLLHVNPAKRPKGTEFIRRLKQHEPETITNIQLVSSSTERTPFVGRERQLAELNKALEATKHGQPSVVLIDGVSGVGKSTLVRHFVENLEKTDPGIVVLTGRCYEQESVPYKAFDSLVDQLSKYLGALPVHDAEPLIPRDVQALARLFPVLRQVEAVVRAQWRTLDGLDLQELRRRGFSALRELFCRLSDRKQVVLSIDDLQWGDTDSTALLIEMLRSPDSPALLLIGSYRSDDLDTSSMLQTLLPQLRAISADRIRELQIEELDASESFDLAISLLNSEIALTPSHARVIARESGGNPLFINELSHYLTVNSPLRTKEGNRARNISLETIEVTLDEVINARYRELPDPARTLLEIVAVAGRPVERTVVSRAARLQKEEESLIMLRSSHLVRTRELHDRQEIETYHDRIRETVNAHISPEILKEHHRRLALALELSTQKDPETLAVHYRGAGDYQRAGEYAVRAAEQASLAFAFDRAARLYQLAIELRQNSQDRRLQINLAEALANAGRGAEAANVYLAATDGAKAAEALEFRRRAAEQLLRSGHIDQGLEVLRTVLSSMGLNLPETPRQALLSFLVQRAVARLRGLTFHERDESQIPPQQITRIDTCWSVAVGLSMVDVIRGAAFQARHLLLALEAGEPSRVVRALTTEAAYTSIGGSRTRARTERLLEKAEGLAKQLDEPDASGRVLLARGISGYLNGEWKKAVSFCEEAETIFRDQCKGVAWERHTACHFSLMSLVNLGQWQQVSRRLPDLLKEAKQRGDLLAETNLSTRMSYILLLAADSLDRVQDLLRDGMKDWSQQGFHTQHYYDLIRRTEIALYSGDGLQAWSFITKNWSDLRRSLIPRIQTFRIESRFLLVRSALAAAAQVNGVGSEKEFRKEMLLSANRSAQALDSEETTYANALCLLSRAGIALMQGRESDSLALLLSAEAEFVANDMSLYAAATRWRRGELVGGDEGHSLIDTANQWMKNQKITRPAQIVEMLSPSVAK